MFDLNTSIWSDYDYHNRVLNNTMSWNAYDDTDVSLERYPPYKFRKETVVFRFHHFKRIVSLNRKIELPISSILHTLDNLALTEVEWTDTPRLSDNKWVMRESNRKMLHHIKAPNLGGAAKFEDKFIFQASGLPTKLMKYRSELDGSFKIAPSLQTLSASNNVLNIVNHNPIFRVRSFGQLQYFKKIQFILTHLVNTIEDLVPMGKQQYVDLTWGSEIYTRQLMLRTTKTLNVSTVRRPNDHAYIILMHILNFVLEGDEKIDGTTSVFRHLSEEALKQTNLMLHIDDKYVVYNLYELRQLGGTNKIYMATLNQMNLLAIMGRADATPEVLDQHLDVSVPQNEPVLDDEGEEVVDDDAIEVTIYELPSDDEALSSDEDTTDVVKDSKVIDTLDKIVKKANPFAYPARTIAPVTKVTPTKVPVTKVTQTETKKVAVPGKVVDTAQAEALPDMEAVTERFISHINFETEAFINSSNTLTPAQKDRYRALSKRYETLTLGDKSVKDILANNDITIEESVLSEDIGYLPDKSALKSSASELDKAYIAKSFERNLIGSLISFHKHGAFLIGIKEEKSVSQMANVTHYSFQFEDINGKKSTIRAAIPRADYHGRIKIDGKTHVLKKQRINKPIVKIAEDKVSLTTNYNKARVIRNSSKAHNFLSFVDRYINDSETSNATIVFGSCQVNRLLPYEYSMLASKYRSISFKDSDGSTWMLNFDYLTRMNAFNEHTSSKITADKFDELEAEYGTYLGSSSKHLFFMGNNNLISGLTRTFSEEVTEELPSKLWDILVKALKPEVKVNKQLTEWADFVYLSNTLPMIFVLAYRYGLKHMLDYLGITYTITEGSSKSIVTDYKNEILGDMDVTTENYGIDNITLMVKVAGKLDTNELNQLNKLEGLMSKDQHRYINPTIKRIFDSIGETNITSEEVPPAQYIFAKDGDLIVGFLEFNIVQKEMILHQLYLNPKYRGRALGSKMLTMGLNIADKRNCTTISLGVYVGNTLAKDMYVRKGFQIEMTRLVLLKKDMPKIAIPLKYQHLSGDQKGMRAMVGETEITYGIRKNKVIWVKYLDMQISDMTPIVDALFRQHPKAELIWYSYEGMIPDVPSPWIRHSEAMSMSIADLRKRQIHIESMMLGIEDDTDVYLESYGVETNAQGISLFDDKYPIYYRRGLSADISGVSEQIDEVIRAMFIADMSGRLPTHHQLLSVIDGQYDALKSKYEYFHVLDGTKLIALHEYTLEKDQIRLGRYWVDESYSGINLDRMMLRALLEYSVSQGRIGVLISCMYHSRYDKKIYHEMNFNLGLSTERIFTTGHEIQAMTDLPKLEVGNVSRTRGGKNSYDVIWVNNKLFKVKPSSSTLSLFIMGYNASSCSTLNAEVRAIVDWYNENEDSYGFGRTPLLVVVRITGRQLNADSRPEGWYPLSWSMRDSIYNLMPALKPRPKDDGSGAKRFMHVDDLAAYSGASRSEVAGSPHLEAISLDYLKGIVSKAVSKIKIPLFDNTKSVTPGFTNALWNFFTGKPKEELYVDKIVNMLLNTTASGPKLSVNDIEKEFIKFVTPYLWKNELVYTKDKFLKDCRIHCPDMKTLTDDDMYDYLGAPACCWIGDDIDARVVEHIAQNADEYPCWATLANTWRGNIRYHTAIIANMLREMGATSETVKLYAVAVMNHERAHSVQHGYPWNDSTDIQDSKYHEHITERDANACAYYAMRVYRDTGVVDANMYKVRIDKITTHRHPLLNSKYSTAYNELQAAIGELPSSSLDVVNSLKLDTSNRDAFVSGCESNVILYTSHYSEKDLRDKICRNIPHIDMGNDVYLRVFADGRAIRITVTKYYGNTEELYIESMADVYTESLSDYVPHIPKPEESEYYYHISLNDLGDKFEFTPRIPEVTLSDHEDQMMPRVCVSTSIEGCILGCPYIFVSPNTVEEDKRFRSRVANCYVYAIHRNQVEDEDFVSSKELVKRKLVFDADVTDEVWITRDVVLERVGKIKVTNNKDSIPIDFIDTFGEEHQTWLFPYTWTDGPTIDIGTIPLVREVCDDIMNQVSKVQYTLLNLNGEDITHESNDDYDSEKCLLLGAEALLKPENLKGTCYDQAIAVAYLLSERGYTNHKTAFVQYNNATHLVTYVEHNGKFTIIETAWHDKRGVHTTSQLLDHFELDGSEILGIDTDVDVKSFYTEGRFTHEDLLVKVKGVSTDEYVMDEVRSIFQDVVTHYILDEYQPTLTFTDTPVDSKGRPYPDIPKEKFAGCVANTNEVYVNTPKGMLTAMDTWGVRGKYTLMKFYTLILAHELAHIRWKQVLTEDERDTQLRYIPDDFTTEYLSSYSTTDGKYNEEKYCEWHAYDYLVMYESPIVVPENKAPVVTGITSRFPKVSTIMGFTGVKKDVSKVSYLESLDKLKMHPGEYVIGASAAARLYGYPKDASDMDIVVLQQETIDRLLHEELIKPGAKDGLHDELYQSLDGVVDISPIDVGHLHWDIDTWLERSTVIDGYRFLTWEGLYIFYKELFAALGKKKHLDMIAWMDEKDAALATKARPAPKYKPKPHDIRIRFKDKTLWINRYPTAHSLIVAGLDSFDLSRYEFTELNGKDAYHRLMNDKKKSSNYLKGIDSFFDLFIDNMAFTDLSLMGEPTNVKDLLIRAVGMLTTLEHLPASSADNHKIRGYEQFNAIIYNEMARQFAGYQARRTKANVFSIPPDAVYLRIVKNSAMIPSDAINPLQDLKESTYLTHAGVGGRTSESFVIEDRKYTESDIGILSEATPDNANVAISAHLSMDPIVENTTGMTKTKSLDELEPANILSGTTLVFPFSTNDDSKRINFISTQSTHVLPTKHVSRNRVRTGYERVVAHRVGRDYAGIANQDGKVIDIVEDKDGVKVVHVQYKDGTKDMFSYGEQYAEFQGFNVTHEFECVVKKGQTLKKGDVVTYNKGFFTFDKNDKQLDYSIGVLATVGLLEKDETSEDSTTISQRLAEKLTIKPTNSRAITFSSADTTSIISYKAVGDHVSHTDSLMVFEEDAIGSDNVLDVSDSETIELLSEINRNTPTAKFSGKIVKIEAYYGCEIADMHPTLAKVVRDAVKADNKLSKMAAGTVCEDTYPKSQPLPSNARVKGSIIDKNTVTIVYYIQEEIAHGAGDKLVFCNQMKCTCAQVFPKQIFTESGVEIDAYFSCNAIERRIVQSLTKTGVLNRVLDKAAKDVTELYFGKK